MVISILGVSKINRNYSITIPGDVRSKLWLSTGDNISYILENNNVIIKKVEESEKLYRLFRLSSSEKAILPREIREFLKLDIGDTIIFLLDEKRNVVIKDAFLTLPKKGKIVAVIGMARIYVRNMIHIPADVKEILDVNIGDNILFILDEDENIIVRNAIFIEDKSDKEKIRARILDITKGAGFAERVNTTIPNDVREQLNVDIGDDIIFAMDENMNIMIRNVFIIL